jgi:hypothetical protein
MSFSYWCNFGIFYLHVTYVYTPKCIKIWPPAFTPVSCLAYSSTLKIEATCSSEASVDFQRTTRRYIPEYKSLHYHRCENLKSYKLCLVLIWFFYLSFLYLLPMSISFLCPHACSCPLGYPMFYLLISLQGTSRGFLCRLTQF